MIRVTPFVYQDALTNIDRYSKVVGLRINASKTKVMSTQPCSGALHDITLGGVPLGEVESFKYLGSSFTATGQAKDEISGLPRSAFTWLKVTLWARREISFMAKGRTYEAVSERSVSTVVKHGLLV